MKVILNDHVEHLGERGDAVTVKPGYARNYLFPQGLAYPDTPGNRRRFEEEQARWEEMDLQRRSAADKLAAELDGTELVFERRAGENDVLFGSVNLVDVGRALADKGFDIDRRRIQLNEPIKELGTRAVDVRVYMDTAVSITVHVVRPGQEPGAPVADDAQVDLAPAVEAVEAPASEPAEPAEGTETLA
jgi:large subunit ribosomal protein L9